MCILCKAVQLKSRLQYTIDGPTRNAIFPFASVLALPIAAGCTIDGQGSEMEAKIELKEQTWFREPSVRSRAAAYLKLHNCWKWIHLSWE